VSDPRIRALFCVLVLTMPLANAQPLSLQAAVAVNDKGLKGYAPYQTALAGKFGSSFLTDHGPFRERRQPCRWGNEWAECGVLTVSRASTVDAEMRKQILEVMREPCRHIDADAVRTVIALSRSRRTQEQLIQYQDQTLKQLLQFCRQGIFFTKDGRVASAADRGTPVLNEVSFEVRIANRNDAANIKEK
jgi:hypothetical protein